MRISTENDMNFNAIMKLFMWSILFVVSWPMGRFSNQVGTNVVGRILLCIVHGVVALGGYFVTLCQELAFYDDFFFIIDSHKEKALLIILIVNSLQIELNRINLLLSINPQSAGINMYSLQSTTTPRSHRRLTLV